jgi:hypothetical protein
VTGLTKTFIGYSSDVPPATLDLDFAGNKNLVNNVSSNNLVTFTRASSGTYVGDDGFIKTATTNLLLQSEDFSTTWIVNDTSVTTNSAVAPNGTTTADSLIENNLNADHIIFQGVSVTADISYTLSIYAKANQRNWVQLATQAGGFGTSSWANFDLNTGTIGNVGTSATASITNVGNGWYHCSITATASTTAAAGGMGIAILNANTNARLPSYTGDGTSSIYIWGAQQEQSSTVGEYIPTTTTINSAPRFDHNPVTKESLGLLVEEQRTNGLLYSEDTSQWLAPVNITLSQNQTTAPDDTSTADQYLETAATGLHAQEGHAFTFVTSTVYTYSVFVKSIGGRNFEIGYPNIVFTGRFARFNLSGSGSVQGSDAGVTASIQAYANGWYRCSATNTCVLGGSSRMVNFINNDSFARSYAGDVAKGLFIWGAQLEAGAFPTSYIPTTTAAVTRSADVASITGSNFSSWYNQSEGTVFANWSFPVTPSGFPRIWQFTEGAAGAQNNFSISTNLFSHNRFSARAQNASVFDTQQGPDATVNQSMRSAMALKAGQHAFSGNGTAPSTNTGAMPSGIDRCWIGSIDGGLFLTGHIRRLTYFPTRLPDVTLQNMTK